MFLKELLPSFEWIKRLKENKADEFFASVVGALLVIPQAIIFAYLAGLPPEYGIYTAIFVTFMASFFGSSPMLGGPNTAVAILIGIAVSPYAGRGSPLFIEYVFILSIMVGLIQLFFWLLRSGKLFDHFNPAAIMGITTGVGFILLISSLEGILGVSKTQTMFFYEKIYYLSASFNELVNYYSLSIGLVTLTSGLVIKRYSKRYYILLSILIGSIYGFVLGQLYNPVITDVELLGNIYLNFAFTIPNFTSEHYIVAEKLLWDALIIAFVGISQSLIITRDLSRRLNKSYNQNKEIYAQGISNTIGGFLGSFAGSGSFNRTTLSLEVGSRSSIPGMLSSFIIIALIFLLNPFMSQIPMAVISGVLFLVGIAMFKKVDFYTILKNRQEKIIMAIVFVITIFIGLKVGIIMALVLSIATYILNTTKLEITESDKDGYQKIAINGNLYYATSDKLRECLSGRKNNFYLDLNSVGLLDIQAIEQINKANERYLKEDIRFSIYSKNVANNENISHQCKGVSLFERKEDLNNYFK